jgi:predicted secreted protein
MNDEQRAVIAASKASGKPHGGPFWAYIRNPKLMQSVQNTAACIADTTLSAREQQIVTLTVARFSAQNTRGRLSAATVLKLDSRNKRSTPSTPAARCQPMTSANCSLIGSPMNCSPTRD